MAAVLRIRAASAYFWPRKASKFPPNRWTSARCSNGLRPTRRSIRCSACPRWFWTMAQSLPNPSPFCRYFEAVQPDPPLFGVGTLQSALVEMWNRRAELHLFFPVASVFQHLHPAMSRMVDPQVPQWGEANKPRVMQFLEFLDRELKHRAYVAGADYTVADITALVAVDFMRVSKMAVPDALSDLQRWHKAVSARPSAAA